MAGFLYFPDCPIVGEVTQGSFAGFPSPNGKGADQFYFGWINLHNVSETVTRAVEAGHSGTARTRSGTILEEITVVKEVDRTTTEILKACSGGTTFPEVFIHLCTSIEQEKISYSLHPYLEFRMFSVKVTSYEIECTGLDDGSIPTETLRLNFDKVVWKYWPIGPNPDKLDAKPNDVQPPTLSGWDVLRSAPFTG